MVDNINPRQAARQIKNLVKQYQQQYSIPDADVDFGGSLWPSRDGHDIVTFHAEVKINHGMEFALHWLARDIENVLNLNFDYGVTGEQQYRWFNDQGTICLYTVDRDSGYILVFFEPVVIE